MIIINHMGCGHSQLENQYQAQAKQIHKKFADEELKTQFINLFEIFDDSQQQKCMQEIQKYFKKFQKEKNIDFTKSSMNIFDTDFYHFTDVSQDKKGNFLSKQVYDFNCKFTNEFQALFFLNLTKEKLNEFDTAFEDYKLIKYNIDFNQIILVESYTKLEEKTKNEIVQLRYIKKLKEQSFEEFTIDINQTNLKNLPFFEQYKNEKNQQNTQKNNYRKFFKDDKNIYRHFCYEKLRNKSDMFMEQIKEDLDDHINNYKQNIAKYMIEFLCSNYQNRDLIWFTYNQSCIDKIFEENAKILKTEINFEEYQLSESTKQKLQELSQISQNTNLSQIQLLLLQSYKTMKNRVQQTRVTLNNLDEELDTSEQQDDYVLEQEEGYNQTPVKNELSTQIQSDQKKPQLTEENTQEKYKVKINQDDSMEIDHKKPKSEQNLNFNNKKSNILSKSLNVQYNKQSTNESDEIKNLNKSMNQNQKEKINPLFLEDEKQQKDNQVSNIYVSKAETKIKAIEDNEIMFKTRSENNLNKLDITEQSRPKSEIIQRRSNLFDPKRLQKSPSLLQKEELQLITIYLQLINNMNFFNIKNNLYGITGNPIRFFTIYHPLTSFVYKLKSGNLWVLSPVQPNEKIFDKIDELKGAKGKVEYLVSPDLLHWLYLKDWKQKYPNAQIIGPKALQEKLNKKKVDLKIDHFLEDLEQKPQEWQKEIDFVVAKGSWFMNEGIFHVKNEKKVLIADIIQKRDVDEKNHRWYENIFMRLVGVLGKPGFARDYRMTFMWPLGSKKVFNESVEKTKTWDFDEILLCHGNTVKENPQQFLKDNLKF